MLIGALALGACGTESKPKLDANDLPRNAAEFVATYNDWDGERMAALYGEKQPDMPREQAKLAWLHERLGDCTAPQLMWRTDTRTARYEAQCERGKLEIAMKLQGNGQLKRTREGAVGVAAPEPVYNAMRAAIAATPWTADGAGQQAWGKALKTKWFRDLGRCELAGVRSVTDNSGRFDLRCEHGAALMRVEVSPEGRVQILLWKSNDDRTRAYQGEIVG